MKTKKIDTNEYLTVLRELTEEGKDVSLLVSGNSMSPFLVHGRDYVYFRKPDRKLRKGDIVFFQRDSGQFVMHRIYRIHKKQYYLIGDGQREIEGPIRQEQIFGLVFCVRQKGRKLSPGDFWWEFFAHIWLSLWPLRPVMIKIYSFVHRCYQRDSENK